MQPKALTTQTRKSRSHFSMTGSGFVKPCYRCRRLLEDAVDSVSSQTDNGADNDDGSGSNGDGHAPNNHAARTNSRKGRASGCGASPQGNGCVDRLGFCIDVLGTERGGLEREVDRMAMIDLIFMVLLVLRFLVWLFLLFMLVWWPVPPPGIGPGSGMTGLVC